MRRFDRITLALASLVAIPFVASAQDESRAVADGGIQVPGWQGRVDAGEARNGMTVENAKFMKMGNDFHVTTGPAITYWNPENRATGDYMVKATFREAQFMNLNNHAHPYGIVIGGNDLGTDQQTFLYCAVYGDGRFIVRGFGPEPFQMNGRRGESHEAINKATAKGAAVTNEVALSVKGDKVECVVNGTVVGSYNKSDVVGQGKLKSTDGVYGVRFGHNTEAIVSGFTMTRQ